MKALMMVCAMLGVLGMSSKQAVAQSQHPFTAVGTSSGSAANDTVHVVPSTGTASINIVRKAPHGSTDWVTLVKDVDYWLSNDASGDVTITFANNIGLNQDVKVSGNKSDSAATVTVTCS